MFGGSVLQKVGEIGERVVVVEKVLSQWVGIPGKGHDIYLVLTLRQAS